MFKRNSFFLIAGVLLFSATLIAAETGDPLQPGGKTTVKISTVNSFSLPIKNASNETRKRFAIGNALFNQNWVEAPASVDLFDGLGPLINAQSCSGCHFKDGRANPLEKNGDVAKGLLFRISQPAADGSGAEPVPAYGDQIQPLAILGVDPEAKVTVVYEKIKGRFPDGERFELLKPAYQFKDLKYGPLPKNLQVSPRIAPAMVGLGLLEAIDEKEILKNADPEDKNKDGISGSANWILDPIKNKKYLGRFGWKANQIDLHHQNSAAFNGDLGITSSLFPKQHCASVQTACLKAITGGEPEISDENMKSVTVYTQTLAVPEARKLEKEIRDQGEKLFAEAQCASCHTPSWKTGNTHDLKELRNQWIYPYTDMLLHDMGEELADHRPDGEANGKQWRTPPLWGLGLIPSVNGHLRLLHDGRARGIQEAILWHSGEASGAKKKYMDLPRKQRAVLIQFVESL